MLWPARTGTAPMTCVRSVTHRSIPQGMHASCEIEIWTDHGALRCSPSTYLLTVPPTHSGAPPTTTSGALRPPLRCARTPYPGETLTTPPTPATSIALLGGLLVLGGAVVLLISMSRVAPRP